MNKDLKDRLVKYVENQQAASLNVIRTREELMAILGLDPDFKGLVNPGVPPGRATGRTTRMLIDALFVMQSEPVLVKGHCPQYTRSLQFDLETMAIKTGVNLGNLCRSDDPRARPCGVFFDHYVESRPKRKSRQF